MINHDNYDDEFEEIEDVEEIEDFEIPDSENFDEVLQLTEYVGTNELRQSDSYVIAEYDNIDIAGVNKQHKTRARQLVNNITKFILDFDDISLSEDHKKYIQSVANLQLEQLTDMLSLVAINKMMLENMVRRINSVQAEDYAMINTYNNILNQHLKLHKELHNTYKNIPATLRKMRLDILENPENMLSGGRNDEIGDTVTENFGETHFNNSKQLLKKLKEAKKLKENGTDI